jgi:hypothetical protein
MVWCGSENICQKDMCSKEIGLYAQNMITISTLCATQVTWKVPSKTCRGRVCVAGYWGGRLVRKPICLHKDEGDTAGDASNVDTSSHALADRLRHGVSRTCTPGILSSLRRKIVRRRAKMASNLVHCASRGAAFPFGRTTKAAPHPACGRGRQECEVCEHIGVCQGDSEDGARDG